MDMNSLLNTIRDACVTYSIHSLEPQIHAVEQMLSSSRFIDVAVIGQFKAGKSSFLNCFLDREILPTGVIPLTSVITRIVYGETEKAEVTFLDMHTETADISSIDEYVSEAKNPENTKNVLWVDIALPSLIKYKGLRFVDTPGLGSIFRHNSDVTEKWAPEIGIAIVAISADRPLSESEIMLIREAEKYSPDIVILLTKTDLFDNTQIAEITEFINRTIEKEFNLKIPVYLYSKKQDTGLYNRDLYDNLFMPLMNNFSNEFDKILSYKIQSLSKSCISYLNLSLEVSRRSDMDREHLKSVIIGERLSIDYLRTELLLLMTEYLGRTRKSIYRCLEPYRKNLIRTVEDKFLHEYPGWKGNLYKISREYEKWLNNILQQEIKIIVDTEHAKFAELADKAKTHFSVFIKSFREKLNRNIESVLGITITPEEWIAEVREMKNPDIRISRASDLHLDMLWFLFPMFFYRNIFKSYFTRQIPYEIDKNLHRVTSDLTGMVNKAIEELKDQTYRYITNELFTIESILGDKQSQTGEILDSMKLIEETLTKKTQIQ